MIFIIRLSVGPTFESKGCTIRSINVVAIFINVLDTDPKGYYDIVSVNLEEVKCQNLSFLIRILTVGNNSFFMSFLDFLLIEIL